MKLRFFGLAVGLAAILSCINANAGAFGYVGTVSYGSVNISVYGPTIEACETNVQDLVDSLTTAGHSGVTHTSCIPNIPDLRVYQIDPKIKFPPICWYCTLFDDKTIGVIYPDKYSAVLNLFYKYKMNDFNAEFRKLELKYNTAGVAKELQSIDLQ
jgi:hypothetical protein